MKAHPLDRGTTKRVQVQVRMTEKMKRDIQRRTLMGKRTRGYSWSQNDQILLMLRRAGAPRSKGDA